MTPRLLLPALAALLLGALLAAAADALSTARQIAAAAARGDAQALAPHLAPALRVPDPAPLLALAAARLDGCPPPFVAALAEATAQALATPEGIARVLSARLPGAKRLPPEALLDRVRLRPDGSVAVSLRSPWSPDPAAEIRLSPALSPAPRWQITQIRWTGGGP